MLGSSTPGLAVNVLLFIKVAIRMWWLWNGVLSQMRLVRRRSHARIKGYKHNVALSTRNSTQTYFLLLESSYEGSKGGILRHFIGCHLVGSSLKRAHTGIHTQPIQTGPPLPHPKNAPTTSHLAIRTNTHRRAPLWERVRRPRFTRTVRKHADVPSWPHRAGFQTLTQAVCGVGV